MSTIETIAFIFSAGVLILLFALLARQHFTGKKRGDACRLAAEKLGLPYRGRQDELLQDWTHFKLLGEGHSRQFDNVISGNSGTTSVTLGDHHFKTGGGSHGHYYCRTICVLRSPELQAPPCLLRPRLAFFDRIGRAFGGRELGGKDFAGKDFDFSDDQEFSGAYVLRGQNEAAARELFDTSLRAWFAARKDRKIHFEVSDDSLVFHTRKLIDPSRLSEFLGEAIEIHRLLTQDSG